MRPARVYIHAAAWPYQRLAYLRTAHGVDRSYKRMEPGECGLSIATNDPQATRDVLRLGNLVVVEGDEMPPWVGPIATLDESIAGATVELQALGLASVLDGRVAPQGETYDSPIGSGAIVASLVRGANAGAHTGIVAAASLDAGPSVTDLDVGGQSVLEALNELHDRSGGYEWWLDLIVSPARIEAILRWGPRQGFDIAHPAHLYERQHFSDLTYHLERAAVRSAVATIGGTGAITGRQAATQASEARSGRVDLANVRVGRRLSELSLSYMERVSLDPTTGDEGELARRSRRNQERALEAGEQITLTVNGTISWRDLRVGNTIVAHARTAAGGDLARLMRISGVQPDEEAGECLLTVEAQL